MNDSSWKTNKETFFFVVEKKRQKECCLPLYRLILVILNVVFRRIVLLLCLKARIRPVDPPSHCAAVQLRYCARIKRSGSMDRNGVTSGPATEAAGLFKWLETSYRRISLTLTFMWVKTCMV
jgi:hypothetical protein